MINSSYENFLRGEPDSACEKFSSVNALIDIMKILRSPEGCPWDREQTHASIRESLLEEACETQEAIDLGDDALLCEELGDLLLQVVFHANLAEERGAFDFGDVCAGICRKLIERHPHVFQNAPGDEKIEVSEVLTNWESIKRKQKGQKLPIEQLNSVCKTLPPAIMAQKLKKYAARADLNLDATNLDDAVKTLKIAEKAALDACEQYVGQLNA